MKNHVMREGVIRLFCLGLMLNTFALVSCENTADRQWKSVLSENSIESYKAYFALIIMEPARTKACRHELGSYCHFSKIAK